MQPHIKGLHLQLYTMHGSSTEAHVCTIRAVPDAKCFEWDAMVWHLVQTFSLCYPCRQIRCGQPGSLAFECSHSSLCSFLDRALQLLLISFHSSGSQLSAPL